MIIIISQYFLRQLLGTKAAFTTGSSNNCLSAKFCPSLSSLFKLEFNLGYAAGVVLSMLRFGPKLALTGLQAPTLTAPFAKVVDQVVTDPWLRKFLDLECFVLR